MLQRRESHLRVSGHERGIPLITAEIRPLRSRLDLIAGDMGITQRHRDVTMTEQFRDCRQRDARRTA